MTALGGVPQWLDLVQMPKAASKRSAAVLGGVPPRKRSIARREARIPISIVIKFTKTMP